MWSVNAQDEEPSLPRPAEKMEDSSTAAWKGNKNPTDTHSAFFRCDLVPYIYFSVCRGKKRILFRYN